MKASMHKSEKSTAVFSNALEKLGNERNKDCSDTF